MERTFTFQRGLYKNNGQAVEQGIRYALTGRMEKADNVPAERDGDCLGYQIKSARATVAKGLDFDLYQATDKAVGYIYGTKDGVAYVMSRTEYATFCKTFAKPARESGKNGGTAKLRLPDETRAMLEWLRGLE